MGLKEAFTGIFQKIKAVSNFDESKFVKTDDIKDFITEQDVVTAITEAYNEVYPEIEYE